MATSSTGYLHESALHFGEIWITAYLSIWDQVGRLLHLELDPYSVLLYVKLIVFGVVGWGLYGFFLRPLNRVRKLGDIGYIPEGSLTMKEVANMVQRQRLAGNCPPVYPNGWFNIMESKALKIKESKAVACLGKNLAVFRAEDGQAHVIDAYCPHMGANLGVGGQVKGDCIECPFHGWRFRGGDGKCTFIPYLEDGNVPAQAKVKSYNSLERNGFIYLWHHAEDQEPDWLPVEIEEISSGQWKYCGRSEHYINAHIEEVPENGADIAHLTQLHSPAMTAGIDLRYTYSKLWSWAKHSWKGAWTAGVNPDDKHIGTLQLTHRLNVFGKDIPFLDLKVVAEQIGPSIVYLKFDGVFGRGAFLQVLTPEEPLKQKMIHHIYTQWYVPTVFGKFLLLSEALQVERDVMVWNNKRYEAKPMFVKSKEDSLIAKHRRWYSQFYSENSPKLQLQKDSIEW